jgi:hypothetical protein
MSPLLRALGVFGAAGLAVTFVALDPAQTVRTSALLAAAEGAWPALLALTGALGIGATILRALGETRATAWLPALAFGIAVQGLMMGAFAAFGAIGPIAAVSVLLASNATWLLRPPLPMPRPSGIVVLVGAAFLFPALFDVLAPATDTDELSYQLAIPRIMAETGAMPGGFLTPDGSRPMPVHLIFAALYALGGEVAPRMWQLGVSIAMVLGVRALAEERFGAGQGDLPALALLGSWSWLHSAGLANTEQVTALWLLTAADALLARKWLRWGWLCGFALAAKYTAAPAVAGMALIALWDGVARGDRADRIRVLATPLLGILPVLPWWIRNVSSDLHPLFPFAGWPGASEFVFMYTEKYGAGRDWGALLMLPWNLLMRAEVDSFVFLGRLSLLWAGLAVAMLLNLRYPGVKRLAVIAGIGLFGWAAGPQILRYLLPVLGIAALAGAALPRRWPALLLLLASLPANYGPALRQAAARAAVVTGAESADTFLERELPAWSALRFLRDHVPADAPVALLFAWHGYHVKQPWILGSVEDHIPTRYWVWRNGDQSLATLREMGVTHLFVGDVRFLKKSYSFLTPSVRDDQLVKPQEALRALLLREATRLFAKDRWEVWRLDTPTAPTTLDVPPPPS